MANFLIINTGGTIGMVPSPTGLTPKKGIIAQLLSDNEQLKDWCKHSLTWLDWQPLLDSSELNPKHWQCLRQQIEQQQSLVDGVLIIHGTDTLAYSAAALSYLIKPTCPIVLTGSMLPALAEGSDAIGNLQLSLQALSSKRCEVMVAIDQLLPASNISKMSTSRFDAFVSPNWTQSKWDTPTHQEIIQGVNFDSAAKVAVFTLFPGCYMQPLSNLIDSDVTAIVIQALGNGNGPSSAEFRSLLNKARHKGIALFVRSQCADGQVNFGQYASSALFSSVGAVGCGNISFESVLAKLILLVNSGHQGEHLISEFQRPYAREWQTQAL